MAILIDGPAGPNDSTNSESILLDWLTTEGNYNKYRGNHLGKTKQTVWAQQISDKIKSAGISIERNPKTIINKISSIEDAFKKAHEWVSNTGQGVKDSDPKGFWDTVRGMCPYYEELEPIMASRASAQALATNNDLDN